MLAAIFIHLLMLHQLRCIFFNSNHSFKTRPGPRPGFRVLTGSPGLTGSAGSIFLKKNQNDVVLVKKQKSTGLQPGLDRVLPGRLAGSAGSHRVFPSFFFSSTRPGSGLGSARSRVNPPGRTMFQNYDSN